MAKLIIDSWLGGISSSDRLGTEGSYFLGEQADPNRTIGYIQPGFSEQIIIRSTGSILTSFINSYTIDPTGSGNIYAIEKAAEILEIDFALLTVTDNAFYPHQINSTSISAGEDVKVYTCNDTSSNPTDYLFYSWNNNSDGDVGRATLGATPSFDDDFLSDSAQSGAKLTKGIPHPMMEWQENGYLYIANGRYLVTLKGTNPDVSNGTADMESLTLPAGWHITSLFDAGEYVGITAVYTPGTFSFGVERTRSAVFFWDGTSDTWNRKTIISDISIRASYSLNGEFYIFCEDMNQNCIIRRWNGTRFILEKKINDNTTASISKHSPRGYGYVDEYKNGLIFPAKFNKIYYYGASEPGIPKILTNPMRANGTVMELGAIANIGLNRILASYWFESVDRYYLVKYTQGNDEFRWKSLYYEFSQKVRLNYIKLYHKTATSKDDDITIEIDNGKSTHTVGTVTTGNSSKMSCKLVPLCNSFRVNIDSDTTSGVIYSKIEIDYDLVDDYGNTD